MKKDPLRVIPKNADEKFDPRSRVNLRKVQAIQHNWKIREIGDLYEKDLPKLIQYRKAEAGR